MDVTKSDVDFDSDKEWPRTLRLLLNASDYCRMEDEIYEIKHNFVEANDVRGFWQFVSQIQYPIIRYHILTCFSPYKFLLKMLDAQEEPGMNIGDVIICCDACFEDYVKTNTSETQSSDVINQIAKNAAKYIPAHIVGRWIYNKKFHQPVNEEHLNYNKNLCHFRSAIAELARNGELRVDSGDFHQIELVLHAIFEKGYDATLFPLKKLEDFRDALFSVIGSEHYYPKVEFTEEGLLSNAFVARLLYTISPDPHNLIASNLGWNMLVKYEGWACTSYDYLYKLQLQEAYLFSVLLSVLAWSDFGTDDKERLDYFKGLNSLLFNQKAAAGAHDLYYISAIKVAAIISNDVFEPARDVFLDSLFRLCDLPTILDVLSDVKMKLNDNHISVLKHVIALEWQLERDKMIARHQNQQISKFEKYIKDCCRKNV